MNWIKEFDGAVTICDTKFKIVYMNDRSIVEFSKYGGADLLGADLLACHNPKSCETMKQMLVDGSSNSYQKEKKDGQIKVIHQSVWKENQEVKGLVEISFYLD